MGFPSLSLAQAQKSTSVSLTSSHFERVPRSNNADLRLKAIGMDRSSHGCHFFLSLSLSD